MKEKEYLLKLLNENMDFHNRNVVMRTILEKHGLMEEVSELEKDWHIDKPCPCEDGIDSKACVGCEHSEDGKRKYEPYVMVDDFIQDYQERFPTAVPRPDYTIPLIWIKNRQDGRVVLVHGFNDDYCLIGTTWITVCCLYENWTYLDGSPVEKEC